MSGSAARTIAIRLTADNAEPTRRALEQVGESGERALRRIDAASAAAQPALQGLAAASDGAVRAFANMGVGLGGAQRVFAGVATGAGLAATAIAALAAGTVAAGVAVARAGDLATESLARLQAATGSVAAAEAAYQGLYRLSQQTGVAVSESAGAFARFALAAREVGATNDQVLALVRTVQQAGIIAGASTSETTSTVMQLGQALASGKLQGDELRSILENMPTLAEALARQLGVGVGELRKMGEEGKLTADVVMPALLRAGERINAEFEKLPPTMGRSFSILGEAMTRFAADLDRALGLSQAIARAAQAAAAAVDRTRVAVGLGTPEETARAGQAAAQQRLANADRQAAEIERSIAALEANPRRTVPEDAILETLRRQAAPLRADRERAIAELERFNREVEEIEREALVRRLGEQEAAERQRAEGQRRRDEASLADLRKALDRERSIREEHATRIRDIDALLSRGAVEAAEAQRLRAAADRERDDALKRLGDTARETGRRVREVEYENAPAGQTVFPAAAVQAALARAGEQQERREAEARRARERAMDDARREVERFEQQSRDAFSRIGENAFDRIGQGLVNAFTSGGKAALDFGSLAKSVLASAAADLAKLGLVNPLANAVFGTTRPTLAGAFAGGGDEASGGALSGFSSLAGTSIFSGLGESLGLTGAGGLFSGLGASLGLTGSGGLLGTTLWTTSSGAAATAALPAGVAGPVLPSSALGSMGMGTTVGSLLGGSAAGFGAGMLTSSIVGGMRGTVGPGGTIGAGVGALAGAAIGSIIPGIGTLIGGLIGGAIGGGGGALFGPTKKGMAKRAGGDVFYGVNDAGQLVITAARGKRWDEAGSRAAVQEQLDRINAAIRERDLRFEGISGAIAFGQASRSARELDGAALTRGLRSGNANVQTALGTLGAHGAGLEEALNAVDWVRGVFETLSKLDRVSGFLKALEDLNRTFDEATARARDLGLSESDLNARRAERIARLEEERANRLQAVDANLTARGLRLAGDERGADLAAFDNTAREEVRQLRETLFQLGLEGTAEYWNRIARLEQTLAGERLAIVERYNQQALAQERARQSTARGLLEQLTIGDLGGLAPETRYFAGLQALNAARGTLADGATPEEVADFARLAQSVLPVARDFLGTSDRYAGLVADIASTIRQAVPGADTANLAALLEAQATGTDRVELAILSTGQQQTEVLRTLLVELRRLTAQNEALLRRVA
ncbi:tape measure protein [Falsiroseomonas ponticola]|uniref:tape measure protein n=1 Tax=Falsiroseomonas ponticola TaxID=2786951 RepID=UPI001933A9E4|nr:tape measure protein [Roseomonas ponticola]